MRLNAPHMVLFSKKTKE